MNRNRGCLPSPRSTVLDRAAASEAGSANVVSGGLRVGGSCEYYGWPSVTIRIISDNMPDDKKKFILLFTKHSFNSSFCGSI